MLKIIAIPLAVFGFFWFHNFWIRMSLNKGYGDSARLLVAALGLTVSIMTFIVLHTLFTNGPQMEGMGGLVYIIYVFLPLFIVYAVFGIFGLVRIYRNREGIAAFWKKQFRNDPNR